LPFESLACPGANRYRVESSYLDTHGTKIADSHRGGGTGYPPPAVSLDEQGGSLVKKRIDRLIAKAARKRSWRNGSNADERLESAVDQLLGTETGSNHDGVTETARADLLAARNGGSQVPGRSLGADEIESLLERMVFSEQAFLKYSH
jgi:hypothetical protein